MDSEREQLEERMVLAGRVLVTLDGSPPWSVRLLARGMAATDGPISRFATAIDYCADTAEDPAPGALARLRLARDLRLAAASPDLQPLLERLADASQPPWPALRGALAQLAAQG